MLYSSNFFLPFSRWKKKKVLNPGWKSITSVHTITEWRENMNEERWGRKEKHTGSPFVWVFEGEGQAVVDRCDLDAGVWTALWPLCILQPQERQSETSPPTTEWMINDLWPAIDHCPKVWLTGQGDDSLWSFISTRQIVLDDGDWCSGCCKHQRYWGTGLFQTCNVQAIVCVCGSLCVLCNKCVCACSSFVCEL